MSVRVAALGALALLVLVLGVYLLHEVHTSPAAAEVSAPGKVARPHAVPADPADTTNAEPPARPTTVVTRPVRPRDLAPPPGPALETAGDDVKPPPGKDFDQKLDAVMAEANKAYDRGDFDEAKATAQKVLARSPGNVRMLRILVSASCIDGDSVEAQKRYLELPAGPDRAQMRTRCDRYGITFADR